MPPDYGPDPLPPLLSLLAQVVGLLLAGLAIAALSRRPAHGLRLAEGATAGAAAVLLAVFAANLWGSARALDRQRVVASVSKVHARENCAFATGVDLNFVRWLADRIPPRERYYLAMPPLLTASNGPPCTSMLLLPRLRVAEPGRARYLALYGVMPAEASGELARPGNTVETFTPGHVLIRRP